MAQTYILLLSLLSGPVVGLLTVCFQLLIHTFPQEGPLKILSEGSVCLEKTSGPIGTGQWRLAWQALETDRHAWPARQISQGSAKVPVKTNKNWKIAKVQPILSMHYRLRSIEDGQFRLVNFASHFIRVQIFQIDFCLHIQIFYICWGQNEHFSINSVGKKGRVEPF